MIRAPQGLREKLPQSGERKAFPARLLEYSTRRQVYTRCQDGWDQPGIRLLAIPPPALESQWHRSQCASRLTSSSLDVIRLLRIVAVHLECIASRQKQYRAYPKEAGQSLISVAWGNDDSSSENLEVINANEDFRFIFQAAPAVRDG